MGNEGPIARQESVDTRHERATAEEEQRGKHQEDRSRREAANFLKEFSHRKSGDSDPSKKKPALRSADFASILRLAPSRSDKLSLRRAASWHGSWYLNLETDTTGPTSLNPQAQLMVHPTYQEPFRPQFHFT
jgi:hypothetical protein